MNRAIIVVALSPDDILPRALPKGWRRVLNPPDVHPLTRAYMHTTGLRVMADVSRRADKQRWLHVSASWSDRCPTHDEMSLVKRIFVGPERDAVHYFPRESEHFNGHPFCLHLWSCLDARTLQDMRNEDGEV